jgi:hypothetical protein
MTFGAGPAQAQIFGRRVVVVNPPYVVSQPVVAAPVAAPIATTTVAPAVAPTYVTSGVVPAGYTTTTVMAPARVAVAPARPVYTTRYVVGPLGRVRRVYSYYPYY